MGKKDTNEDDQSRDDKVRAAWYDAWDPKARPADYPKPNNR